MKLIAKIKEIPTILSRCKTERDIQKFCSNSVQNFTGPVLIDSCFDNPHYWFRYSLIRKALGLNHCKEIGILSKVRTKYQKITLHNLNINDSFNIDSPDLDRYVDYDEINNFFDEIKKASDIPNAKLPFDFDGRLLYDYILKKERKAFVDHNSATYKKFFVQICAKLYKYNHILNESRPKLVISSHAVGEYSTLVHLALNRGIKVIVPFGDAGLLRFWQMTCVEDIFDFMDRPKNEDFSMISDDLLDKFREIGKSQLDLRFSGSTNNLGATYAFKNRQSFVTKKDIYKYFGSEEEKPIACVYASNWFDYPHTFGMNNYTDFYDWINSTLKEAKKNKDILWLLKPHPVEEYYGGQKLRDLISDAEFDHIKFADDTWNGHSLMKEVDMIVTFHGSIGVESSALGKPVLIADKGWYHDCDFVLWPKSKNEYQDYLKVDWSKNLNLVSTQEKSEIFCGWYWGAPEWQQKFLLDDDSNNWSLYPKIRKHLKHNLDEINIELQVIKDWFYSSSTHYHTYKMRTRYSK